MLGLSSREIARTMQIGLSGFATTQFREGDESIEVVARLEQAERTDLGNLKDAKLYLSRWRSVALSQVARLDARLPRTASCGAAIACRRSPCVRMSKAREGNDVTAALQPRIDALGKTLPLGYSIVVAGSSEASATSQCRDHGGRAGRARR